MTAPGLDRVPSCRSTGMSVMGDSRTGNGCTGPLPRGIAAVENRSAMCCKDHESCGAVCQLSSVTPLAGRPAPSILAASRPDPAGRCRSPGPPHAVPLPPVPRRWRSRGGLCRGQGRQQLVARVGSGDPGDLGVVVGRCDFHDVCADEVKAGEWLARGRGARPCPRIPAVPFSGGADLPAARGPSAGA